MQRPDGFFCLRNRQLARKKNTIRVAPNRNISRFVHSIFQMQRNQWNGWLTSSRFGGSVDWRNLWFEIRFNLIILILWILPLNNCNAQLEPWVCWMRPYRRLEEGNSPIRKWKRVAFHHRLIINLSRNGCALHVNHTDRGVNAAYLDRHTSASNAKNRFIFHSQHRMMKRDCSAAHQSFIKIINYAFKCSHLHLQPKIVFPRAILRRQPPTNVSRALYFIIIIRIKLFRHCCRGKKWKRSWRRICAEIIIRTSRHRQYKLPQFSMDKSCLELLWFGRTMFYRNCSLRWEWEMGSSSFQNCAKTFKNFESAHT